MTLMDKVNLYEYDTPQRRQWALYLLTQAAAQGKKWETMQLVFDRFGGVSLLEVRR